MRTAIRLGLLVAVAVVAALPGASDAFEAEPVVTLERLVSGLDGGPGDGQSGLIAISGEPFNADGSQVALTSQASNLVPGDTNGEVDVFLTDLRTGSIERVSLTETGQELTDGESADVVLTADGDQVVFASLSTQLSPVDSNDLYDLYVKDLVTGAVELISARPDGTAGVAGDLGSFRPAVSADARFVAFRSDVPDLVAGDVNGVADVFVRDRVLGVTELVTRWPDGTQPDRRSTVVDISADGRYVVFETEGNNLGFRKGFGDSAYFLHDRVTGEMRLLSRLANNRLVSDIEPENVAFSADGETAVLGGRLIDLGTGVGTGAIRTFDGGPFLGTRVEGITISANGRYVAYATPISNIVEGDTNDVGDVFRFDRRWRTTIKISTPPGGGDADNRSRYPVISDDGSTIVFESRASNLVDEEFEDLIVAKIDDSRLCQGREITITGAGTINGTPGDDVIEGSPGPDVINGGGGNDVICGRDGDDLIRGGAGNDRLYGGPGTDDLAGGTGGDLFFDGDGPDRFRGGPGHDTVDFSDLYTGVFVKLDDLANDGINGEDNVTTSIETVIGSLVDDILIAGPLGTEIEGGQGDDVLRGSAGPDTLDGGPGDDVVRGGAGEDLLLGGIGADRLIGGPGDDTLDGGFRFEGNYCRGSAGTDTYFNCDTADP